MPKAFVTCVNRGGRVRTKQLGGGKYIHLCFRGGVATAGEVKKRKKK